MKKIKREMEPIVFRSLRTPGLEGQRKKGMCLCVEKERGQNKTSVKNDKTKKIKVKEKR